MQVGLILDACFSFIGRGKVIQRLQDGTTAPVNITGWVILFVIIIDIKDRSLDILTPGVITDELGGKYELALTDVNRDAIFAIYPNKKGLTYEVKATFSNDDGIKLAEGVIGLKNK